MRLNVAFTTFRRQMLQEQHIFPDGSLHYPGVMVHDVAASALGVSLETLARSGITNRYAKTVGQCFG
jgi:hypothetical protein